MGDKDGWRIRDIYNLGDVCPSPAGTPYIPTIYPILGLEHY